MTHAPSQTTPMLLRGRTGSGKGSVLWHPMFRVPDTSGPPAFWRRGRTIRRRHRLGSGLRLPSRRRSRTDRGA
jgi:hypothetical protein